MNADERQKRAKGVGASEVAAIMGADPHASALEVYLRKIDPLRPSAAGEPAYWGTRLQDLILDEFSRRSGRPVGDRQRVVRSRETKCLWATLDATAGGDPVEVKTVGLRQAEQWERAGELGAEGTDEVPTHWLVQATAQLYCAGQDTAWMPVLIGGQEFRLYRVRRSEQLVVSVVEAVRSFWHDHVRKMVPPAPTTGDAARLREVYGLAKGTSIDVDAGFAEAAAAFKALGMLEHRVKDAREALKVQLLERMKGAETANLPDGRRVRRVVVNKKTYTVSESSYEQIRVDGGAPLEGVLGRYAQQFAGGLPASTEKANDNGPG